MTLENQANLYILLQSIWLATVITIAVNRFRAGTFGLAWFWTVLGVINFALLLRAIMMWVVLQTS